MRRSHIVGLVGLVVVPTALLALVREGAATAYPLQYCKQLPIVGGIPP
jgi:hypothetical protein